MDDRGVLVSLDEFRLRIIKSEAIAFITSGYQNPVVVDGYFLVGVSDAEIDSEIVCKGGVGEIEFREGSRFHVGIDLGGPDN